MKIVLKAFLIFLVATSVYFANYYNLGDFFTLDFIKSQYNDLLMFFVSHPIEFIAAYMGIYILITALAIPWATVLTLLAGAIFGVVNGTIVVSFASTIGATLSFLLSRYLLRDYVQTKFADKIKTINEGIEKEGAFYLFTLRLVPLFPFFLINLVMGLTPIGAIKFFFVSQIGMFLGTIVYVNAGTQLTKLSSLSGILSFDMIVSFSLLGIFPLVAKKIIALFKARKVYKIYKKPKSFDYNMISIGAGAAGLVTSYIGAAVKAKCALIEKHKMGGDCLNTGCVPSKAILKSASVVHQAKNSQKFGIKKMDYDFDFKEIMNRVSNVIEKIEPHDSVERYTELGVDCIQGEAKIISPWEVEVNGKIITTKNIIIATGASPFVPSINGLKNIEFLTSENLWQLEELPAKMVILGGGPIGLEMAQSFQRLGSDVTVVEMAPRILAKEDVEVSEYVKQRLIKEGVEVLTEHKAVEIVVKDQHKFLKVLKSDETSELIGFTHILVAVGRAANIKGFGLDNLDIEYNPNRTIKVNEFLQTKYPNIYACGDVAGPYQLTHMAAHQAWFCAVNGLFGKFKKFKVDYSVVPWATYTDPEVATVGLIGAELDKQGIEYDEVKYGIDDLDRAIADSSDYGFVKVWVKIGSDKILGATIVGSRASDYIIEFISAMKNNIGLNKILGTIHPYPTMSEANKFLAGQWKQANKPEKLLSYLERYFKWVRS